MARMRSPSYPSISLKLAIDSVEKIHKECRTNVVPREVAADAMGYSGLTGRSMQVLASLIQFGLLAKAGKGDVKVTQTAVDILHGINPEDRDAAMLKAGFSPQLFKDIHERFPDGIPSENAIRSFLIQQDFADAAIGLAINSFMETYHALENIRESKSYGSGNEDDADSSHGEEGGGAPPPPPPPPPGQQHGGHRIMEGERVVFSEETSAEQYLKLVTAGEMNEDLLEALEDYIKRQKKRLGITDTQTKH